MRTLSVEVVKLYLRNNVMYADGVLAVAGYWDILDPAEDDETFIEAVNIPPTYDCTTILSTSLARAPPPTGNSANGRSTSPLYQRSKCPRPHKKYKQREIHQDNHHIAMRFVCDGSCGNENWYVKLWVTGRTESE